VACFGDHAVLPLCGSSQWVADNIADGNTQHVADGRTYWVADGIADARSVHGDRGVAAAG
jgi:hypothetical protein